MAGSKKDSKKEKVVNEKLAKLTNQEPIHSTGKSDPVFKKAKKPIHPFKNFDEEIIKHQSKSAYKADNTDWNELFNAKDQEPVEKAEVNAEEKSGKLAHEFDKVDLYEAFKEPDEKAEVNAEEKSGKLAHEFDKVDLYEAFKEPDPVEKVTDYSPEEIKDLNSPKYIKQALKDSEKNLKNTKANQNKVERMNKKEHIN